MEVRARMGLHPSPVTVRLDFPGNSASGGHLFVRNVLVMHGVSPLLIQLSGKCITRKKKFRIICF